MWACSLFLSILFQAPFITLSLIHRWFSSILWVKACGNKPLVCDDACIKAWLILLRAPLFRTCLILFRALLLPDRVGWNSWLDEITHHQNLPSQLWRRMTAVTLTYTWTLAQYQEDPTLCPGDSWEASPQHWMMWVVVKECKSQYASTAVLYSLDKSQKVSMERCCLLTWLKTVWNILIENSCEAMS